ncbi:Stf0 family sulfotransferase [Martelella limonii]|uniref:Stf0 family sulfotransferase n=1 Tax=Martelella limonii TaxID=1647649 RepID=UPI001580F453|nr:Stf0 family sulfotransferase [Martelella limonii]
MASPYRSYIICTSPRSGSTLLCRMLSATGISGAPDSHFHRPSVEAWMKSHGVTSGEGEDAAARLTRVFDAAVATGTAGTGMFGLRLQCGSFPYFMERLAELHTGLFSDMARIEARFGPTRIIHLTRTDKVAQAVSCVKAEQTGLWHVAPDGTEIERLGNHRDPVYDGKALQAWYDTMVNYERQWEDWFAREGIAPLRLDYDRLSLDPRGTLRDVLLALGLDGSAADRVSPVVKKIADDINDDWAVRLRAQIAE